MKKVKGYIERKTMLYKTGVEYGDYTMNHIQGCAHGCKYPCVLRFHDEEAFRADQILRGVAGALSGVKHA